MFIQNKYFKYYYNIIDAAKSRVLDGYTETHHIVPKSLGGTDNQENLVILTAREHFVCHLLLTKMTVGVARRSMVFALNALSNLENPYQSRYKSKLYALSRELFAEQQSIALTGPGNHMYGIKHTAEAKKKMSDSHRGKAPWNLGKPLTEKHKQNISNSSKGENNSMYGKSHSSETKELISLKNKGHTYNKGILKSTDHKKNISDSLKGKPKSENHKLSLKNIPKITCIQCNKSLSPSMHTRWHGDKCKWGHKN